MRDRGIALTLAGLLLVICGCRPLQRQAEPVTEPVGADTPAVVSGVRLTHEGFAILDFRAARDEHDRIHVIGEVKNVSTAARGVELQASLRDASGRVVAVGNFYPASNHNIMPGEIWPFTYSFGRYDGGVRAELRIVGGFRTIETLTMVTPP